MRYPTRKRALAMGLAAAALAACGALHLGAEEAPATAAGQPSAVATPAPPAGDEVKVELPLVGMTVAVDPVTGRLRQPTPAEARELAAAFQQKLGRTGPPPQAVHHRDGMLSLVVGADYLDFMVATVDASGNVMTACVEGAQVAPALNPTPAAPALEEE